jgi:hypothetical protein
MFRMPECRARSRESHERLTHYGLYDSVVARE